MRYSRQDKILEIISEKGNRNPGRSGGKTGGKRIQRDAGDDFRDIKELQLIKTQSASGRYKLRPGAPGRPRLPAPETAIIRSLKNTVSSISASGNIIVLKTLSGCANAAGEAIDSMGTDGILGTLAGDNTLFIVVDSPDHVPEIVRRFSEIMGV